MGRLILPCSNDTFGGRVAAGIHIDKLLWPRSCTWMGNWYWEATCIVGLAFRMARAPQGRPLNSLDMGSNSAAKALYGLGSGNH